MWSRACHTGYTLYYAYAGKYGARETIPCGSIISMDCWYNKKRLISTDAALHKIHVQYYMKVRMLQCKYFIKCIYVECCYEVKIVHFFCW